MPRAHGAWSGARHHACVLLVSIHTSDTDILSRIVFISQGTGSLVELNMSLG